MTKDEAIKKCGTPEEFDPADYLLLFDQNSEKDIEADWQTYCQMAGVDPEDADARHKWDEFDWYNVQEKETPKQ
jgi:hypothetical protein